MAILLDKNTKVIVQGITGYQGQFHTKKMINYGTNIVAGVTPGKGGQEVEGVPVFDSVSEAVEATGANASIIFVPQHLCKVATLEALEAEIKLLVVITEGIPKRDVMVMVDYARNKGAIMIGPNCPGLITPGQAKLGIIPGNIVKTGEIGVVSRSGTLTYEVIDQLTRAGMGQSSCVGIGGDPIKQTNFIDILKMYQDDPDTKKIAMIGEIGGNAEEKAAEFIKSYPVTKPVVAFIAGKTAKEGKTMGHAGAIVQGGKGTAEGKIEILSAAGVKIAEKISDIPKLLE